MPRGSSYEERIADLVVDKLEQRLPALLARLLRQHEPSAHAGHVVSDIERADYERRSREASHRRAVSIERPIPPRKRSRLVLECGHTVWLQTRRDSAWPDADILRVERWCRQCHDDYRERHPPPPLSAAKHAELEAEADAAIEGMLRRRRRR